MPFYVVFPFFLSNFGFKYSLNRDFVIPFSDFSKKIFIANFLKNKCDKINLQKKRKKILAEWKMVVFLHSLSPRGRGC